MAAATVKRHATRALLRAHLSAASGYRHLTRHCPICHRLLRLAMEPSEGEAGPGRHQHGQSPAGGAPTAPRGTSDGPSGAATTDHPGRASAAVTGGATGGHPPAAAARVATDGDEGPAGE
ncbi:DUF6274 family protein [Streptomyces yaizuensis]|uniref:DUF6274 family protein n=1 Tax=Streptomyces yaizuensis TaxID=2989713 RepID=A0ABQ5P201_9ACTN|nr:DUF6274 family protein [Streptomyces sp. YSPA8]GLF96532.1 DUF6274 family protein [Streptomyces sp. YSPA8]